MMDLVEKVVILHHALVAADVPHAFGGALALAYCTLDPRGTSDIDCNLFVAADHPEAGLDALPPGVEVPAGTATTVGRDGQVRLWWEGTPLDLFFDYADVHAQAARRRRVVDFAGVALPVLGCTDLVLFKAFFDRTKDWADIEAVVVAGTLDVEEAHGALSTLLGPDDHRVLRLAGLTGAGRPTGRPPRG